VSILKSILNALEYLTAQLGFSGATDREEIELRRERSDSRLPNDGRICKCGLQSERETGVFEQRP
jgi:hypothetical protein